MQTMMDFCSILVKVPRLFPDWKMNSLYDSDLLFPVLVITPVLAEVHKKEDSRDEEYDSEEWPIPCHTYTYAMPAPCTCLLNSV